LFDLRRLETIYTIDDHILPNYCDSNITISTDRKFFAIGSTKGDIFIFNLASGEVLLI